MENINLIDGSAFAFLHGNKENYKQTISEHFDKLCSENNTDKYILYLENSRSNFRNSIGKTHVYKGHREAKRDKISEYLPFLEGVFEELRCNYNPVTYYGVENDDALSLSSLYLKETKLFNPVICGDDSDLLQIEGDHYKLRKNIKFTITQPGHIELDAKGKLIATGIYATYSKIIKGAVKENYKGLHGYGDKKVFTLLSPLTEESDMRKLCFDLFVKEFGYNEGIKKVQEGFRLCYLLRSNKHFKFPTVQTYNKKETTTKKFIINAKSKLQ
jgi:hypothetical protein